MKPAAVPTSLPRIPPGSTLAAYNTTLPSERFVAISRTLADLADGLLEHEKIPDASRMRARHLIDGWFGKLPESFGFSVSPTQQDDLGLRHIDTTVTRLSEPPARVLGIYTDLFGLLTDPAAKAWAKKKKFDVKADIWPKVTKKTIKLPGFKLPGTSFELAFNAKAWDSVSPKVAEQLERLLLPGHGDLLHGYVVVQPDGDFTYVLTNDDPKELARVAGELHKTEPGVFFAKPAHSDQSVMAGFLTLVNLARYSERSLLMRGKAKDPLMLTQALAATPHHGESPITFASTTGPGSARIDIEIPADAFADASAAAVSSAAAMKGVLVQ
jgi:hypothetical protein